MTAFVVTWLMYWKGQCYKRKGLIFGTFLLIVFVTRFLLEFIKLDQEDFEAGMMLNMGQWLSLPFIIWGVYLIVQACRKEATH
jgi:prolipoprotein diacylglyceryltransferase